MKRSIAFLFCMFFITTNPVLGQNSKPSGTIGDPPLPVTIEIHEAGILDGKKMDLQLKLLMSDDGFIKSTNVLASKQQVANYCVPLCYIFNGKQVCLVPVSCGGSGGGGVLLEKPLLVEVMSNKIPGSADGSTQTTVSVRIIEPNVFEEIGEPVAKFIIPSGVQ